MSTFPNMISENGSALSRKKGKIGAAEKEEREVGEKKEKSSLSVHQQIRSLSCQTWRKGDRRGGKTIKLASGL